MPRYNFFERAMGKSRDKDDVEMGVKRHPNRDRDIELPSRGEKDSRLSSPFGKAAEGLKKFRAVVAGMK